MRLWAADGSKEVYRWTLTPAQVGKIGQNLTFAPDGKRLAAGGETTIIWDVEKRTEVRSLPGEMVPVYSPDGQRLLTVRGKDEVVVRDSTTWAEQFARRINTDFDVPPRAVFSRDGKRVAAGGTDGVVHVWEVAAKTELQTIRGQQGWVFGLAFSADGTRLVTSVGDEVGAIFGSMIGRSATPPAVRVWDLTRNQDYRLLPKAPKDYAAHPTRPEVAIAEGKEVGVYDLITGAKRRVAAVAPEGITAVAYRPDGATLAVAWTMPVPRKSTGSPGRRGPGSRVCSYSDAARAASRKLQPYASGTAINEMAFSPDGKLLAATGGGSKLLLLDAATGKEVAVLDGAAAGAMPAKLAFGPNGLLLRASTGIEHWSDREPATRTDGVIEVWDVPGRSRVRTVDAGKGFCYAIAVSPDGKLLAVATGDRPDRGAARHR